MGNDYLKGERNMAQVEIGKLDASSITVREITNKSLRDNITAWSKCGLGSFQPPSEKCIFCGCKLPN